MASSNIQHNDRLHMTSTRGLCHVNPLHNMAMNTVLLYVLQVNDSLQTTAKHVFAVGDCCTMYKFTHAADFMARAVIRNALFFGSAKMSQLLIPRATFLSLRLVLWGNLKLN